MKTLICLTFILLFSNISQVWSQQSYYFSFDNFAAMAKYFEYHPTKKIVAGHRGTIENGMPENHTASFEEVLKHCPAVFEIDPRLTKDSVVILMHDETLDRTTTGTGKVSDYTWEQLQKLYLKDAQGNVTNYRIQTLDEVIEWAKGKTILNLDIKDVPPEMTAAIIAKHDAYAWVWVTVHTVQQARYYLEHSSQHYLSMHLKDTEALQLYRQSGLPYDRMIVYIGAKIKDSNKIMYDYLHAKGVMCMISAASSYDKLLDLDSRKRQYQAIMADGASILETDYPIAAAKAISE